MNVIRVAADTFRRDPLGACGNDYIKTPARGGTLFERPDNLDGRAQVHRPLIRFMEETGAARGLIESRREPRL